MERKEFLKQGLKGLGMIAAIPVIAACKNTENVDPTTTTGTTGSITEKPSTNGSSASDCAVTNTETAGPFPTKDPKSLIMQDITGGREGTSMIMKIGIKNKSMACAALVDVIVDVWYCDAKGNYSEYGGTGDNASLHYLRGRQTTDAGGFVSFKAIFPGWYKGRAPHIHVQIFNKAGKSLLITQIAFPKTICDKVYTEAKAIYGDLADTTNEKDGIFNDGYQNQIATVTGNKNDGYKLEHAIVVVP
jgi:protocatechuate 3,4-dioxygenase beta subunit